MYFPGLVVGKALTIGIEILPNFHRGVQKVRNLASFKTSRNFEPHALVNAAIYPKSETEM